MNQSCTYRIWFRFCDAILVILSSVLFAGLAFGQTSSLIQELLPNQTLEREMKGAETHRYKFDLKANEFFQVRVDQKGVDIALKLLDENGNVLATMDSPNGKEGFETLSYVAEQAGSFTLEVSGLDAKVDRGSYTIKREASRAATEKDKRRVEIEKVFVEGIKARGAEGQRGIAINKLKEALAGWEELSDDYLKELTVRQIEQMEIVAIFQGFYSDSANAAKTLKEAQTIMVKSRLDSLSAREKANEALSQFRALSSKLSDNTIIERITSLKNEDWLNALKELQLLTKAQGAYSLSAIAQTHYNLGEWQKRVDYLKQVVNINQELIANDYFKNSTNLHDNYFLVKVNQANEFLSIGQMLYVLGQLDEAMEFYNQALQSYRSLFQETQSSDFKIDKALFNFKLQEALVLKEMGNTYSRSSENRTKAIASYSKAVEIYKGFADNKRETAKGLFLIADKYALDLNYEAALRTIEESLKYFEELDDKSGQAGVLELKGILYFWLNDKTKANDIFNKIIRILQSPDFNENDKKNRFSFVLPGALQEKVDDAIERERLDGIATAYKFLENFQKSNEFYEKSLAIARSNQDNRIVRTTLRLIAFNYASLKQWDEAAEYYQQAVSISRTDKAGEELADDLRDLGWTLLEAGKYKEALQYQNEALIIYQSVGVAENKGFTQNYSGLLNELSRTHYALDNKRLAIFYGKRAVNAMQGERQRLQNLDLISQRGFLERKEKHYRRLADWLIAEGRIAEAEQVLALFKQDEYFDSLPLNKKLEVIESQAMDKILLSDAERDAFNRYEEIANHLAAVGKEYDALEKKSKNFEAGKFSEQARLDKLSKELAQAGTVFNRFLEELDVRFRNLPPNPSTQVSYSRTLLRKINQPRTVIVSTIVGQERLNLIVTTARTYRAYPVEIKAANLNKLVI